MRIPSQFLILPLMSLAVMGCSEPSGSTPTAAPSAGTSKSADPAPSSSPVSGLVIQTRGGGQHPDRFCMPTLSITNQTDTDVGALLVEIEWRHRDGGVLQAAGEYASIVEKFDAGKVKEVFVAGFEASCDDLQLVVGTYACRTSDAVRTPCPAPVTVDASGGVTAELSRLQEGPLRGAVEPAS